MNVRRRDLMAAGLVGALAPDVAFAARPSGPALLHAVDSLREAPWPQELEQALSAWDLPSRHAHDLVADLALASGFTRLSKSQRRLPAVQGAMFDSAVRLGKGLRRLRRALERVPESALEELQALAQRNPRLHEDGALAVLSEAPVDPNALRTLAQLLRPAARTADLSAELNTLRQRLTQAEAHAGLLETSDAEIEAADETLSDEDRRVLARIGSDTAPPDGLAPRFPALRALSLGLALIGLGAMGLGLLAGAAGVIVGLTTGDWEGLILVFLGVYVGLALIAVGAGILLLAGILAGIRFLLIRTEPEAPL